MGLKKLNAGVEDLTLGMDVEHQERRGTIVFIQQLNGMFLPYSVTQSVNQKIDQVEASQGVIGSTLNNHLIDISNPHKVTIEQIGAAPAVHDHNSIYYQKIEHVDAYGGVSLAGKPIVLDSNGYVNDSLLTTGGLYYQGPHEPTDLDPYPDTTDLRDGSFWAVDGLGQGIGYTWVAGDLTGKEAFDGFFMFWSSNGGWSLRESDPSANVYYALDGSRALVADFAGGGFKLSNIADGTDPADAVTLAQLGTKVLWRNKWDGALSPYAQNDMVIDGSYTMIANKETSERPAPQLIGEAVFIYDGTLVPFQNVAKQIIFGQRYTIPQTLQVSKYRVEVVAGNEYSTYLVIDPLGDNIITSLVSFTADIDGWQELSIPSSFIKAGDVFDIIAVVNEPDPTPTVISADYEYSKPTNITAPLSGQIVHSGKSTDVLNISFIDANVGSQEAMLDALNIGDIIELDTIRWAIQSKIKLIDSFTIGISPATQSPLTGTQPFSFETVTATPITIGREVGYNTSNAYSKGLLGIDVSHQLITPDDNQYGIDLELQEVTVSEDWDFVAVSSAAGSSGGTSGSGLPDETDQKGKSVTNHGSKGDAFWSYVNANPIVMTTDQVIADGVSASVVSRRWSNTDCP